MRKNTYLKSIAISAVFVASIGLMGQGTPLPPLVHVAVYVHSVREHVVWSARVELSMNRSHREIVRVVFGIAVGLDAFRPMVASVLLASTRSSNVW